MEELAEPKTYSRKRRPKGKIPCVAIGKPRITRTRVKPVGLETPKLHDFRAWIPTGKGKEGLVYIASQKTPTETVYEGVTYYLIGIRFNGDLVMRERGDL